MPSLRVKNPPKETVQTTPPASAGGIFCVGSGADHRLIAMTLIGRDDRESGRLRQCLACRMNSGITSTWTAAPLPLIDAEKTRAYMLIGRR